ncbi:MAG: low molecular weight phosphotyrosine protein phosphatase [Muribaculaceae bacterium]|nr:low molecular weight phosphotyrosine protein phosphatase [Muribaculaceae bacterium]
MKPESKDSKYKILFVCLGNICRSPAAEGVMKTIVDELGASSLFYIDSAGTGGYHVGDDPDHRMRIHARRRGYELQHKCRKVSELDFDRFDLIIGMDDSNIANLRRLAPTVEAEAKIHRMAEYIDLAGGFYDAVPDPYYEGSEGFELVLDLLENGCRNLANQLLNSD